MPALSRDDVAHLARLARLRLTDDEIDHYAGQLDAVLEAVSRVSEVATADVPATSHPIPLENVYRDDIATPSLPREALQAGAPSWEDDRFRVPRILDEE